VNNIKIPETKQRILNQGLKKKVNPLLSHFGSSAIFCGEIIKDIETKDIQMRKNPSAVIVSPFLM
jgi:hypothetical protein